MPDDPANERRGEAAPRKGGGRSEQPQGESAAAASFGIPEIEAVINRLLVNRGVPITLSQAPVAPVDTTTPLNNRPAVNVAYPPCTDVLLSLIKTTDVPQTEKDHITLYFDEYFRFRSSDIVLFANIGATDLDRGLVDCLNAHDEAWPPGCCLCPSCIELNGNRNPGPAGVTPSFRRLFIADLVWLYYFDRFGIFRILGVILDDFATTGRFPISNGSLDPGLRDDITALILEAMVRETKSGLSSGVRERESTYRRCLGWASASGRKLTIPSQVNTGFSTQFHRFIYHALEFFKDRRLAVAVRGVASPSAPPSAATLVTLSDTIDVLKKRFEVFDYGRNFFNTLNGIVWAIAAMSVVREIRTTLGIPPAYNEPHEYLSAAYDLLVARQAVTGTESNRYTLHRECARDARDILLDIEALNEQAAGFAEPGGELDRWLTQVEGRIEGYRTAYRALTSIDLGETRDAAVEQRI